MINRNTFAFRLNMYVVSLITFIAIIVFASYYFISRSILLESVEDNARNIAEKNVNQINAVIGRCAKIPNSFASLVENVDLNEEQLVDLLRDIVVKNDEVYGSAISFEPYSYKENRFYYAPYVFRNGDKIKISDLNDPGYAYLYQDWYQIPKRLERPLWSEPYYDEGGGNILMITYSVPFYKTNNGRKTFRGVITIDIALDWLTEIVSSIKIFETGFAFVLSQNGAFVTHPTNDYILNESIFSLAEEYNLPHMREIGRKMVGGESGLEEIHSVTLDADSKIYFTPFKSNSWSIAVMFPVDELYAGLNNLSWFILLIGIVGLGLIIVTITTVSNKLTKPLTSFSKIAKEIGGGKFNVELPDINTSDEVGELRSSFKRMQTELTHYIEDLKATTAEMEKMESELRIAHQIQMGMIPKIFPPFPDRDDIDLYAFLDPAKEVGGDLYDFFFVEDDKLVITVGDVAGKGVPASLFMAVTRTLIRSKMVKGADPSEVIDAINEDLMEDNDSKLFVTLVLCIINLKTREVEWINAGHNHPYIVKKDGSCKQLKETHGMALGVFKMNPYKSNRFVLDAGDKLVLYSDGVNEAMNSKEEQYDYDRFEKCLINIGKLNAKESTALVLEDIKKFTDGAEQSDDITLLIHEMK